MGSDGGSQKSNALAPFLVKTYDMVDDPSTDHIVSWSSTGSSFVVWNSTDFCRDLLPQYFKHNNLSSFVRQLNTYGFRKICPDQWEFATEGFLKGQRDALKSIRRKKPLPSSNSSGQAHDDGEHQQPQSESPKCMILAHQELEGEVKRLQQDKKLLLDQLTKLQHEQKSTETNLLDLGNRLQSLEERQQQILTFLARVANPAFWAQFVQNPSESNMLLLLNKKRRLLPNEEFLAGSGDRQEVLVGMGESGDNNENVAGATLAEKDALGSWWTNSKPMPSVDFPCEGILRQLSPRLPQSQSLGSSPISLSSGVFLREVHTPAECVDIEESLVETGEHQQGAVETGDSTHNDGNIVSKITADKHALGTLSSNAKSVFSADVPGEGIFRQLSLCLPSNQSFGTSTISLRSGFTLRDVHTPVECPPSNQSLGTSPISLSSGVTLREVHTPVECQNTPMHNVSGPVACAGQSSETMDYSIWTRKSGDDRIALSLHLRDRLRCISSSAPKSSERKIRKKVAGSNDGFWEKYLTESPSSTDSEADSETENIENASPRERQFL